MIYAVVPLDDNPGLESRIKALDPSAYTRHGPKIYFLSYDGTSADLSEKLGFVKKGNKSSVGVVLKPSHTNGVAFVDLWEWFDTYK